MANVNMAFSPKPTAMTLSCGNVRPIRPSTSVANSAASTTGMQTRTPS